MGKRDFNSSKDEAWRKAVAWARGRNGADELSGACTTLAVILVVIDLFAHTTWVSVVALALLAYSLFRITSKNITARGRENSAALHAAGPVLSFLSNPVAMMRETRAYVHLRCPSCGQLVRIPRGRARCASPAPSATRALTARRRHYAHGIFGRRHRLGQVNRLPSFSREGCLGG